MKKNEFEIPITNIEEKYEVNLCNESWRYCNHVCSQCDLSVPLTYSTTTEVKNKKSMKTTGVKDEHYCSKCGTDLSIGESMKVKFFVDGEDGYYQQHYQCKKCGNNIVVEGKTEEE